MSLSAKREALTRIHGRYGRAGRPHKASILDEFCETCGYHRKAALRLLKRPLRTAPPKCSGPKLLHKPAAVLPVLPVLQSPLAGQRPSVQQAAQGRAARMARTLRAAVRAVAGSF